MFLQSGLKTKEAKVPAQAPVQPEYFLPVLGSVSSTTGGNIVSFTQPLQLTANQVKVITVSGDVKSASSLSGKKTKICLFQPTGLTDWNGNKIEMLPGNTFPTTFYGYATCADEQVFKISKK